MVSFISSVSDFMLPFAGAVEQIDLLPYHRIGMHKYKKLGIPCDMPGEEGKADSRETEEIYTLFESNGFKVKIGG